MATTSTLEASYFSREETPVRTPGATLYIRVYRVPVALLDTLMPAVGDTFSTDSAQIVTGAVPSTRAGARAAWVRVTYKKRVAGGEVR